MSCFSSPTPHGRIADAAHIPLRFLTAALLLIIASTALQAATAPETAPRQSVRLLHIGNSFSNNATAFLPQLARSGGKELLIFGASLGGCSFERHARHLAQAQAGEPEGSPYSVTRSLQLNSPEKKTISLPEALAAQRWDFVTIQQVSHQSFKPETFEPYAGQLIAEVRRQAPEATLLVHQTWAYRPDHALFQRERNLDPHRMHMLLSQAYAQLAEHYGLELLPSGNALALATATPRWRYQPDPDFDYAHPPAGQAPQEQGLFPGYQLRRNREGIEVLSLDAYHLNPAGRYLAGCVWYEILFSDSVLDVDFTPPSLTPEEAADLRRIAHQAVAEYRQHGLLGLEAATAAE